MVIKAKLKKKEIKSMTLHTRITVIPSWCDGSLDSVSVPVYLSAANMIPYSNKAKTIGICIPMYQISM